MNELELLARYRDVEPIDPAMINAAVDAIVTSPDSGRGSRSSPRGSRRHPRRVFMVTAAIAAAALAAITFTSLNSSDSPQPSGAADINGLHGAMLASYITAQSITALDTAAGYVEKAVQEDPRGTSIQWRGPNVVLDEVPDQESNLETWAPNGASTVFNVDYVNQTWYKSTFPPLPVTPGTTPPAPADESPLDSNGGQAAAASIAAWFHRPGIRLAGTATVDATSTYQLEIPAVDPNGKLIPGETITAWVDTTTYLPVRMARYTPAGAARSSGVEVTIPAANVVTDFTWFPATPETLAVFNLTPPASFRQITDPALQPLSPGH